MKGWRKLLVLALLCVCGLGVDAQVMRVEVDGRDLPRGLLHARMRFEVEPGVFKLWYPQWIPGVHGPVGPIQNMAGLRVTTAGGEPLPWARDDLLLYQFWVDVPEGTEEIVIELDYICNQPSVNSVGVDSYGNSRMGIINWNTCLLYPDGVNVHEYPVEARLRLPEEWRFGTALRARESGDEGWVELERTTFAVLVDSPVLAGEHFRTVDLGGGERPVYLHLASETPQAIEIGPDYIEELKELVEQAERLFGRAHYDEYHFLVGASDAFPTTGLEHLESSLNVVKERDLVDEEKRRMRAATLLPHEYVHSWCGKFRRPEGMFTPDYHTDKRTQLLWIYEGLTTYLGELLAVRSGQVSLDKYRQRLADKLSRLMHIKGREWRPLVDTAVVSHQLRARSKNWGTLRRNQDYYHEGLLFWLEADARIRRETGGRKSLDDFCRRFFGFVDVESDRRVVTYDLDDVVRILNELAPMDWKELIQERIFQTSEALALNVLELLGLRLEYASEPSEWLQEREERGKYINALDSLGLQISESGRITEVVPGMPGDEAGLAPGMTVAGVNRRKFSRERLRDALAESIAKRKIDLLVLEGDLYRDFTVEYAGGPKYLRLVKAPSGPDLLEAIYTPLDEPEE